MAGKIFDDPQPLKKIPGNWEWCWLKKKTICSGEKNNFWSVRKCFSKI
jgi:hypothetical protein